MGALRQLAEKAGVELSEYRGERGPSRDEKERLVDLHEEAVSLYQEELGKRTDVLSYLKGRGLSDETISKWRLGYAPAAWRTLYDRMRLKGFTDQEIETGGLTIGTERDGKKTYYDRFRGRIMFPISDPAGRIIAFSGRFFEAMPGGNPPAGKDQEPAKYVNSPETPLFHKSHVLYGFDRAKAAMRRYDFAILVEGQMDLLMMHQCGFPNALASSGTAFTEEHLRLISHSTKKLVLALDADAAGIRSALRSAELGFKGGFDLRVAAFPQGKDPADVGKENPEELKKAVREAKLAIDFFIDLIRHEAKDERTFRRRVEEEVLPLIASMQSRIDQAHFIQRTARALELPDDAVASEVARRARTTKTSKEYPTKEETPQSAQKIDKQIQAGALIVVLGEDADIVKLKALVSEEQFSQIEEVAEKEREQLLFMIEREEGSLTSEDLFVIIEDGLVRAEIEATRRALQAPEAASDENVRDRLTKKLQDLTRKQHRV